MHTSYLDKTIYDTNRKKHRVVEEKHFDGVTKLISEEGSMLKIYHNSDYEDEYASRFRWLQSFSADSDLAKYCILPSAGLMGLKYRDVGYVCRTDCKKNLCHYTFQNPEEKLFKWYSDITGGLAQRLKIGCVLAEALRKVHTLGYYVIDICPENIFFDAEQNAIFFAGTENISSYTRPALINGHAGYTDPLVAKYRAPVSVSSDTYSYAMVLFQLLTACHPFAIGAEAEQEIVARSDCGEREYVGNFFYDSEEEEIFKAMRRFVPEELLDLFYRMFVSGKLDGSKRPTLVELQAACSCALQNIAICRNCQTAYPHKDTVGCPRCGKTTNEELHVIAKKCVVSKLPFIMLDENKGIKTEEEFSHMVIYPGVSEISTDFLSHLMDEGEHKCILQIQYERITKKINIKNCLHKLELCANGKVLYPQKSFGRFSSNATFVKGEEIVIEFPENALPVSEEFVKIMDETYGEVRYKWIIIIS